MAMPGQLGDGFAGDLFHLPPSGRDIRRVGGAVQALRKVIRDYAPDVVHAHNPGIMIVVGVATRRGRSVPALTTLHGSHPDQYRLNARAARIAGLPVIACGPTVAEQMRSAGSPVQGTILNGVEVLVAHDRSPVRRLLGVPELSPFFVQVGRLAPQKNPLLSVEAFARGASPAAWLAFVGDGELAPDIRAAIECYGVQDRVLLLGGRTDAHDIIGAADVVLLPSSWEGHPLVLLEAMYLGRAVLASCAPGIRELITHGLDGLLVAPNVEALGQAMRRLCEEPATVAALGQAARERRAEFSQDRMVEAYLDAYRRVQRRGSRAAVVTES